MALHEVDRELLQRCLTHRPGAWERLVDRFLGLVCHVINHTARCRSIRLSSQDFDDLASEVFLAIVEDDYGVLRRFRGESSLATYLTVVARRVVVRELLRAKSHVHLSEMAADLAVDPHASDLESRISDREQVEQLLGELDGREADVVRLFHLEGKSYDEISSETGIPTNSVGPTLSRARARMRGQVVEEG
ncbi:MAG: sigma-70 family RNA polymerase sigma factor [Planctomycetes bacterium]|nr:sigma-70 family RNA polymerase sigma factor [Planctomycetota bacterium]